VCRGDEAGVRICVATMQDNIRGSIGATDTGQLLQDQGMDIMSSVVRVTCLCVVRKAGRVSTGRAGRLGASRTRMVRLCVGGRVRVRVRGASAVAAVGEGRRARGCWLLACLLEAS